MTTKNTSNAFAASLSFGFEKEAIDYSVNSEDTVIEKYAGISIYQPTIDNAEHFLRKYVMNELTGTEGVKSIDISIIPNKFDTMKPDYIKDAQGVASIRVENTMLELPFMILDEEFLPFDIIQLDKQRVPYSRENLRKVVAGIINQKREAHKIPEFEPYKKLDKPINPASSVGFLGDVLKIQEQHAFRTTSGGNMYVTASAKLDDALEKLAEMKPVTEEDWKVLEGFIRSKVVDIEVDKLQKQASEVANHDDGKMAMIFNRVKEIPFVDANSLPHGTVVAFPEVQEKEISMNKGIIIDDYMDMAGYNPRKMKIIVSQDSRMKILDNYDRFLCIKIDPQGFRIHARELDILMGGDVFFAFDGNKALVPCVVERISERLFKNGGEVGYNSSSTYMDAEEHRKSSALGKTGIKVFHVKPVYTDEQVMAVFSDDGVDRKGLFEEGQHCIKLATLSGMKFGEVPYNEYIKKKSKELGIEEMNAMSLAPHYDVVTKHEKKSSTVRSSGMCSASSFEGNVVFCTDENTKIIRIKGLIKHHMRNKADLELMANASVREFEVTAGEDEGFEKTAGVEEMCKTTDLGGARLPDSPMPSYWLYGQDQSLEKKAANVLKAVESQASRFKVKTSLGDMIKPHGSTVNKTTGEMKQVHSPQKSIGNGNQNITSSKFTDIVKTAGLDGTQARDFEEALLKIAKDSNVGDVGAETHAHTLATKEMDSLAKKGYLSPDKTRIIKPFSFMGQNIKGKGFDHVKDLWHQALKKGVKLASEQDSSIEKLAGNEYIELRTVDKERGTYDLKISHIDRNKKLIKDVTRTYKAVPYNQVREILKAVGYDLNRVSEILQKARNNNYAKYELPADATPTALSGGQVLGPVQNSLSKIKSAIYDSNVSDAIAAEVIGAMLAGAILGGGRTSKPVYDAVSKFATEARALSSEFEKVAMDKSSISAREVAKTMSLAAMFNEKVAEVVIGKAQYFKLNDVVDDILESRFALEKMASDLITLKIDQAVNGGEMLVNPGYIQSAVKHLDHMFRLAGCLEKTAERIVADDKTVPDLTALPTSQPDNRDYDKYRNTSAEDILKQYPVQKGG